VPEDLDGEEKNKLYQMLRLEVTPEEGYEVSGAFCTLDSQFPWYGGEIVP